MRAIALAAALTITACWSGAGQMPSPEWRVVRVHTEPHSVHIQLVGAQDGWPVSLTVRCDRQLGEALVTYVMPFMVSGAALVECDRGVLAEEVRRRAAAARNAGCSP